MTWQTVATCADGLVVKVDAVDGSVDIVTPAGATWQFRPEGLGSITVRLDARPPVLLVIPTSGNSVVLKPLGT